MDNVLKVKFGKAKSAKALAARDAARERERYDFLEKVIDAFDCLRFVRQDYMARFGDDPLDSFDSHSSGFDISRALAMAEKYNQTEDGPPRPVRHERSLKWFNGDDGYKRFELTVPSEGIDPQLFMRLHDLVFGEWRKENQPALPFRVIWEPSGTEAPVH
ncbi:hypothetical protein [Reyranella sp.]|uniref:hypothetical protein n=1 Tax=Reyranella sp. TaxID=1929291 RepID=UPI003D0F66E3